MCLRGLRGNPYIDLHTKIVIFFFFFRNKVSFCSLWPESNLFSIEAVKETFYFNINKKEYQIFDRIWCWFISSCHHAEPGVNPQQDQVKLCQLSSNYLSFKKESHVLSHLKKVWKAVSHLDSRQLATRCESLAPQRVFLLLFFPFYPPFSCVCKQK